MHRRLLAFALALILPVAGLALLIIRDNQRRSDQLALDRTEAATAVVVATVEGFVASRAHLLQAAATDAALRTRGPAAQKKLIQVLALDPSLLNVYATDRAGRVRNAAVWAIAEPLSVAPRPGFRQMLGSEAVAVSSRHFSAATGQTALTVLVPLRAADHGLEGALAAEISLKRLQDTLIDALRSRALMLVVTDPAGEVLVHSDYSRVSRPTFMGEVPPVRAALHGRRGSLRYQAEDGSRWVAAYSPTNLGWAVVVQYPEVGVITAMDTWRWGVALLALLAVVLAGAALVSAHISRPLERLVRAAEAMAQGAVRQRVPERGTPEVVAVASTFNRMSARLADYLDALHATQAELDQKQRQLRHLLRRTVKVQEEERRRIAAEVHDGITQTLVGGLLQTQAAANLLRSDPTGAARKLLAVQEILGGAIEELKRIVLALRPPVLDRLGLIPALERLCHSVTEAHQLPCRPAVSGQPRRLTPDQEVALYRIVQEALQNVVKHAAARSAVVGVHFGDGFLEVSVTDDGIGLRSPCPPTGQGGLGLAAMRERAEGIGGQLTVVSTPGGGTRVTATLQLASTTGKKGKRHVAHLHRHRG